MKKRILSLILSTLLLCALFPFSAMASSSYITYSSHVSFSSSDAQVKLTGDAEEGSDGIILTPSEGDQAGAAFFNNKVKQSDGFSTFFKFTLNDQSDGADGIVFIIAKDTNQLGEEGGGIGYTGIDNSVGIEFDTYHNASDISNSHIGIDLNGELSSDSNYNNDAVDMGDGYFHDVNGTEYYTWVDYHNGTLEVRVSKNSTRPTDATLSKSIDLANYCGDEYYVGFTAATGGAWEEHKITQWYFNNQYSSVGLTPNADYDSDSTAPTKPTISLTGTTLTCSGSTDAGAGLDHYEYQIGSSGAWTTVNSVTNKAELSNSYTGENFTVNARAIDKVGNISELKSLSYDKPEVVSRSSNAITISAITGCQYAITAGNASTASNWSAVVGSDGTMTFDSLSAGTKYKLWVRSDSSESEISRSVYTAAAVPVTDEGYTIDYDTEKISISSGYEVSTDSAFGTLVSNHTTINTNIIYYVRKAIDTETTPNTPASEAVSFSIGRPASPSGTGVTNETILNKNDGTITGVTTAMQYKISTISTWTDVTTNGAISGLSDGIYSIRYKAVTTGSSKAFASNSATVTIMQGAPISVTFEANGGSATPLITGEAYGNSIAAPSAPTKTGYYFGGWYKDSACVQPWSFGVDTLTQDITLYAKWSAVPTYTISGAVVDDSNLAVSGASVKVLQGTVQSGNTVLTDTNGDFEIDNVPAGTYNLIITKGSQKATVLVMVADGNVAIGNAALPSGNANSILEVSGTDTPNVVVGNLNTEATTQLASEGLSHTVEIKLTVTKDAADNTTGSAISTAATSAGQKIGMILDLDLTKTVDSAIVSSFNETASLIEIHIPLPADLQGKESYTIYRYHNSSVDTITTIANANGEYLVLNSDKTTLTLYAKKFSAYLIAYTSSTSGSHHSSSGGATASSAATTNTAISVDTTTSSAGIFSDVNATDWYYDAVNYMTEKGLMNGITPNSFGPATGTTRGMMVTILYRLEGQPTVDNSTFEDVSSSQYYAKAIAWGEANGIVKGYSEIAFGPNDNITREQMAAILHRYVQYKGIKSSLTNDLDSFYDAEMVSYWAVSDVQWAVSENLLSGISENIISPTTQCTRGQVATMLMRLEKSIMAEN